jgi:stage II sporulation protein D
MTKPQVATGVAYQSLWLKTLGWQTGWLALVLWLAIALPAAALNLRVAIAERVSQVQVGTSTVGLVRTSQGRILGQTGQLNALQAKVEGNQIVVGQGWRGSSLWLEPQGAGFVWIGDRWYRGRTLLTMDQGRLSAINYVELEEYLYSVLGGEMADHWPLEALKAQAVAARSYALSKQRKAGGRLYDVGDSTTWQVYKGIAVEGPNTISAVKTTAGQVLTYEGQVIEAVFHSSSGGHTENVEDVWSEYRPYLRAVVDYDQGSPVFQWNKVFSAAELGQRLKVGTVRSMTPVQTTTYGSVKLLKVVGDRKTLVMKGTDVRKALDLRSARFTITPVTPVGGAASKAVNSTSSFQVVGYGFGHGLGLSQWGAYGLAQQGQTYPQILAHYYQRTTLSRLRF